MNFGEILADFEEFWVILDAFFDLLFNSEWIFLDFGKFWVILADFCFILGAYFGNLGNFP